MTTNTIDRREAAARGRAIKEVLATNARGNFVVWIWIDDDAAPIGTLRDW